MAQQVRPNKFIQAEAASRLGLIQALDVIGNAVHDQQPPKSQRLEILRRVIYAVSSALVMALFLAVFGKPIEPWAYWLFVVSTFIMEMNPMG